jgi:hypothetical protein
VGPKDRNLADGEQVILNLRAHVKAVLRPLLVLVLVILALVALWWFLRGEAHYTVVMWVAGVVALGLVGWLVVVPILEWNAERYVITNRRSAHRTGILNRKGRDIPCTVSTTSRWTGACWTGCSVAAPSSSRTRRRSREWCCTTSRRSRACRAAAQPAVRGR